MSEQQGYFHQACNFPNDTLRRGKFSRFSRTQIQIKNTSTICLWSSLTHFLWIHCFLPPTPHAHSHTHTHTHSHTHTLTHTLTESVPTVAQTLLFHTGRQRQFPLLPSPGFLPTPDKMPILFTATQIVCELPSSCMLQGFDQKSESDLVFCRPTHRSLPGFDKLVSLS